MNPGLLCLSRDIELMLVGTHAEPPRAGGTYVSGGPMLNLEEQEELQRVKEKST